MKEDINFRLIKKLKNSKYEENIREFLINAIREEFARSELHHWSYAEVYDQSIKKYATSKERKK
ncbi:hypothetical protein ES703_32076 [subsurface metagenome]